MRTGIFLQCKMKLPTIIYLIFLVVTHGIKLEEKFSWKEVSFAWPSKEARLAAIESGQYIPKNNLPLGLEIYKNRLFVTFPRWKAGVGAPLTYIDITSDEKSPVLQPYPNWEANKLPIKVDPLESSGKIGGEEGGKKEKKPQAVLIDNSTIISTFRPKADECDRLWVVDTGLADILGDPKQITPPAIVIFDLQNDQLIRRYLFKESEIKENSSFANIALDVSKHDCNNAFAYVIDLLGYGVIVYSFAENKSWRIEHDFFRFDPLNSNYKVAGINFQWIGGIFTMAIGNEKHDGTKDVFFHPFSSTKEFSVSNRVLQNESYATSPDSYNEYKLVGDRGPNGQSTVEVYDKKNDVIFYTQINKNAISCWNANKSYTQDTQSLVDSDNDTLIFSNDMTLDKEGFLWVLSDRLPVFIYRELNPNDFNYRILRGRTTDIIKSTPCEN